VKFALVLILEMASIVLAGCQSGPTVEEARALCTKQGGFLVVFYTQKVTLSGLGPEVATPGDCISPSKFDLAPAAPASPAPSAPVN
jgi:hypothetical protein